jgi:hypothetical protein
MKKIIVVFVFLFVLVISCKTKENVLKNTETKELNYIPYYLKVYEAKENYELKNYEKSFSLLDSLFREYDPIETPTIYEMDLYCELSVLLKIKNKKIIKKVLKTSIVKYGRKPYLVEEKDSFWNEVILHSGLKSNDFDDLYKVYVERINYGLKDTIVEMYKRDQMFRKKDENYSPSKFDSIDKLNANILLNVLKKYGYPRENLIGGMDLANPVKPNYLSTILMHLNYDIYKNELEILLYRELQKGNLCPMDYAMMSDRIYSKNKEKMINYIYLGTYKNILIQDTLKTNHARTLLGLPKIK